MSNFDSPAELIARFLRANDYTETLEAFIREAALPDSVGTSTGPLTLETLLEEKRTFDLSRAFEKLGTENEDDKGWSKGAPAVPSVVSTLPAPSNVLHTSFEHLVEEGEESAADHSLLATTADRRLNVLLLPSFSLQPSTSSIHESPVLSCATLRGGRYLLTSGMSGQLSLLQPGSASPPSHRRDHAKYVVKIATYEPSSETTWIATAGWDAKVQLYRPELSSPNLPAPIGTIALPTNPESLAFVPHPDSGQPILIVTRRDSSFLYFYSVSSFPTLLGRQNLAPHSTAWVAFTPSAIALCPTDPSILAIATSATPHMKLIITRLLIPPPTGDTSAEEQHVSAAAQARADLAKQDREAAAVLVHCSTLAPQTPYSTPALAWRPDGTGVWVNSDDGVVRGFEAATGKLVASLAGHDAATKIRCLAAGKVKTDGGELEEWLVSGGFDQKLIVWRPEGTAKP
ncbi:hypothetical protein K461DRAFT_221451 [Myriangium duriaei CBS 260.36]|uniref:LisH domain-containing protein n=1 Tax=Myriangium duriaei CBS 260.36 TaxID=1168546 RepID=A0A9P4JA63_9PEZI|nr:hypothetical protein K461DRAFT_221451 [Myriangium duriaei CBS 260.36]